MLYKRQPAGFGGLSFCFSGGGLRAEGTSCPWGRKLREMDFLNIPERLWIRTQPPANRHPVSKRASRNVLFRDCCLVERNIKKISFPCASLPHRQDVPSAQSTQWKEKRKKKKNQGNYAELCKNFKENAGKTAKTH